MRTRLPAAKAIGLIRKNNYIFVINDVEREVSEKNAQRAYR